MSTRWPTSIPLPQGVERREPGNRERRGLREGHIVRQSCERGDGNCDLLGPGVRGGSGQADHARAGRRTRTVGGSRFDNTGKVAADAVAGR